MKKILFVLALLMIGATSCSMQKKLQKTPPEPTHKLVSINSFPTGAAVYMEGKYLGVTPLEVKIPLKYRNLINTYVNKSYPTMRKAEQDAEKANSIAFKFVKNGYEATDVIYKPTIKYYSPGKCKNYNGQLSNCKYYAPEAIYADMQPLPYVTPVDTTIPGGESGVAVTRDAPGASGLEKTIIRWYFDSEPRGARVFWRVISSIPAQVKNTNESYLGTTPFEETRSFNILGLTYENSRDVQIEIKVTKPGYVDQTKRFNVSQAIDQMEISSFYDLVPAE